MRGNIFVYEYILSYHLHPDAKALCFAHSKPTMMKNRHLYILLLLILSSFCCQLWAAATVPTPYQAEATANVRVRKGPGTGYAIKGTLKKGETVKVIDNSRAQWLEVDSRFGTGWVSEQYLKPSPSTEVQQAAAPQKKRSSRWNITLWDIIKYAFIIFFLIGLISSVWEYIVGAIVIAFSLAKWTLRLFALPFFITNVLQRYLAKPWILFFHDNHFSDATNAVLRKVFACLKVPLYILLTPLRLVNAAFFNLVVHCPYELFNYALELLAPTHYRDGSDGLGDWLLYLPKRLWKYGIYHPALTLIESLVWTIIDTFIPALTLYHGTSPEAARSIVSCPYRTGSRDGYTGIWNVGSGNFAGNGIYFAPARSTSQHYSSGSMIVCRVTLGRTLDLGLAPWNVFRECGHADALNATRWGLNNGYVTGEWWRPDEKWWEYCMYDWQNRYNYSWRIRPLYVINLNEGFIQRTPCGMAHWLFQKMVLKDLGQSIREKF